MNIYIFLTNQYLPKPGATGVCVHQLAKELSIRKDNKVFVVCYGDIGVFDNEIIDGVEIRRIKLPLFYKNSKNKFVDYLYKICKIFFKLFNIFKYPLASMEIVHAYCSEVIRIINLNKGNKLNIIASYTPFEAIYAVSKIKQIYKDSVRTVYYSTDTLSNEIGYGILPASIRQFWGIKRELEMFSIYDKILLMECHKKHYRQPIFDSYHSKISFTNFPLLTNYDISSDKIIKEPYFVYVGTLYKKLRNPKYLCLLLDKIIKKLNMKAYFIGGGDCQEELELAHLNNRNILFLGMQTHEIAQNYINNAACLLSIGNKNSPMMPSKIFEYMATGKPIIHIYSYEEDPCIEPLIKYGNSLVIKEYSEFDDQKIIDFVKNSKIIDFSYIEKIFETSRPGYTISCLDSYEEH